VTLLAWLVRRRCPGALGAWAYYLIALAPVCGILPLGELLAADRYSYLPTLSFAVLAGAAVAASLDRAPRPWLAVAVPGLATLALTALAAQAWQQTFAWRDTASLWLRAVEATPECGLCHMYLGNELLRRGLPAIAVPHLEHAVALRPDRAGPYRALGGALEALGRREEAMACYRRGLAAIPTSLPLGVALATALTAQDRLPEALAALKEPARFYVPRSLVSFFEAAVAESPTAALPRLGLVHAWLEAGDPARARSAHLELRRLHPGLAALVAPALEAGPGAS
jgi:tetratricopeptide (TPR) repeat protein